mgnify:CR=1 FL=1
MAGREMENAMKNRLKYIILLVCPLLLGTCSVSYSFSGASLSPEMKTISIARFPNNALLVAPILSSTLTDALQERFARQTKLIQVPEKAKSRITRRRRRPFPGMSTQYSIT